MDTDCISECHRSVVRSDVQLGSFSGLIVTIAIVVLACLYSFRINGLNLSVRRNSSSVPCNRCNNAKREYLPCNNAKPANAAQAAHLPCTWDVKISILWLRLHRYLSRKSNGSPNVWHCCWWLSRRKACLTFIQAPAKPRHGACKQTSETLSMGLLGNCCVNRGENVFVD